MMNMVER
jgi:hypothetical protein